MVEIDGRDHLFPVWEKDDLFDRYTGKAYPCSDMEDFVSILAEKFWKKGAEVLPRIHRSPAFQTAKRDPKKDLTIGIYYHSISNGGAQRITAMLANLWADKKKEDGTPKYRVVLITDENQEFEEDAAGGEAATNSGKEPLPEYEVSSLVLREYLPSHKKAVKENYRIRFQAWARIIETHSIDLVVSGLWVDQCTFWDMLSVKCQPSHPAFILQNHNFCAVPFLLKPNHSVRLMHMYSFCDAVVVLSKTDIEYVGSFSPNVRYIPNPIFYSADSPLSDYEEKRLLWVGRFSSEKNPLDAVEVMNRVVARHPSAKLFMVGTGDPDWVDAVSERIEELGLKDQVLLTGFTLDVEQYYSKASLFISTAQYEGFPTTSAEAFSFGLPIVEYEMPWLAFSEDERGLITVPQGDVEAMAEKIVRLLDDPKRIREIGQAGKEKIQEFIQRDIQSDWDALFESVFLTEKEEKDPSIVLKYITEFQQLGKDAAVKQLKEKNETLAGKNKELKAKLQKEKNEKKEAKASLTELKEQLEETRKELSQLRQKEKGAQSKQKQNKNSGSYGLGKKASAPLRYAKQLAGKVRKKG